MKNLDEFINYINKNMTGKFKDDIAIFYRNILPKDRQLTIDESLEVIKKCPKLFTVLLGINPDNVLVNSSSLYSAFKTMTEDQEVENDFNAENIINERDKVYFSDMDYESLKLAKGDLDLLRQHLSEIGPIKILTGQEVTNLFKKYNNKMVDEETRNDARNTIWIHNLKLSASMAKKYCGRGVPILDLIQQGHMGLLRAIEKYDYTLGYNFSTYATWWVKQSMTRYIADNAFTVRVPVHIQEKVNKIRTYVSSYIAANNCEPTKAEILSALKDFGVTEKTYDLYKYITTNGFVISLDKKVSTDASEDADATLGDFISSDEDGIGFDEKLVNKLAMSEFQNTLLMCGLKPRELKILKLRYGIEDGRTRTLEEVGREFGVTRERIRQIEVKALRKLRNRKNRELLKQFREDYGMKEEYDPWTKSLGR